jgi:stress-induced morphogen
MDVASLRMLVESAFPTATVEVVDTTGGGDHFDLLIVDDRFGGMSLLQRHRLVYDVLGDLMRAEIHALSLRTVTAAENDEENILEIARS